MPNTHFTFSLWYNNAGNNNPDNTSPIHAALILSRGTPEPWPIEDVRQIVRNAPHLRAFLRADDFPYFIVPSPPTMGLKNLLDHPLMRQPPAYSGWRASVETLLHRDGVTPAGDKWVNGEENHYQSWSARPRLEQLDYRYLLIPCVDTVLSREMHPSTLNYAFDVVYREQHWSMTYQDLWESCDIAQIIFKGYAGCVRCDLRGGACTKSLFETVLPQKGCPLPMRLFQLAYQRGWYGVRDPYEASRVFEIAPNQTREWGTEFKRVREHIHTLFDYGDQEQLPGTEVEPVRETLTYVPPALCQSPHAKPILDGNSYLPSSLYTDLDSIESMRAYYKETALTGAKTRKNHNATCGYGKNACILRNRGCWRWKLSDGCKTRWSSHKEMWEKGVAAFEADLPVPKEEIAFAMRYAGTRMTMYNPDTRRTVRVVYGGLCHGANSGQGPALLHVVYRDGKKEGGNEFRGEWKELMRWLQVHAPDDYEALPEKWDAAQALDIPVEEMLLYAEMCRIRCLHVPCAFGTYYPDVGFVSTRWCDHYKDRYTYTCMHMPGGQVAFYVTRKYGVAYCVENTYEVLSRAGGVSTWFRWVPA